MRCRVSVLAFCASSRASFGVGGRPWSVWNWADSAALRTSIDAQWQLDDGEPSAPAALAYLFIVLAERLEDLRAAPRVRPETTP